MKAVLAILARRALQAVLAALLIGTLSFLLMRTLPGDPAFRVAAGRYGYDMTTAAAVELVRAELHLDRPGWLALIDWWRGVIRLDFGQSLVTRQPALQMAWSHIGQTFRLASAGLGLSVVLGVPAGIWAGLHPGGWFDRTTLALSVVLRSLPAFVLGLLLIILFSLRLNLLPVTGFDQAGTIVLPALTLALGLAATSSRITRDAMAAVEASAFYAFGRSKGLGEGAMLVRHGLRNIALPVVAYLGVQFAFLVEGVVVVETLFSWPGIGHALVHALFGRDVPVIQAVVMIMSLMFVALNTLVDLACLAIDPRRRQA